MLLFFCLRDLVRESFDRFFKGIYVVAEVCDNMNGNTKRAGFGLHGERGGALYLRGSTDFNFWIETPQPFA